MPMSPHEDPISSDPALLWTWTRYIGVLIALLAISLGASESTTISLDGLSGP